MPKHLPLVEYWELTSLPLSDDCVATATGIGGYLDKWSDSIIVPCVLELSGGQRIEKAILRLTKQPPYWWYPPEKVFWANQIEKLHPSDFALSIQVRCASHEKMEEAMGFAPTDVQTLDGRSFTLGCRSESSTPMELKGRN